MATLLIREDRVVTRIPMLSNIIHLEYANINYFSIDEPWSPLQCYYAEPNDISLYVRLLLLIADAI